MRTSKKLLSFFLAVVMVVTTCSVGFTAFAKDNNSVWSTDCDAQDAFATLDGLANMLPSLLMGIDAIGTPVYEKYAKDYGKAVDELTADEKQEIVDKATLQDILGVLQPTLINLLESESQEDFVSDLLGDDSDPSNYNYLNGRDDSVSFYTLYSLCVNYADNKDLSKESRETLKNWKEQLQPLADLYQQYQQEESASEAELAEIAEQYTDDDGTDCYSAMLYQLKNFDFDVTDEQEIMIQSYIAKMNTTLKAYGSDLELNDFADLVYYLMGAGANALAVSYYVNLIQTGGGTIDYNATSDLLELGEEYTYNLTDLTFDNYADKIIDATVENYRVACGYPESFTFEQYAADLGYDGEPYTPELLRSVLENLALNAFYNTIIMQGDSISDSSYYIDIVKGLILTYSDKYKDLDALEADIDSQMPEGFGTVDCIFTDDELADMAAVIKAIGGKDNFPNYWEDGYVDYSQTIKVYEEGYGIYSDTVETSATLPDVFKGTISAEYFSQLVQTTSSNYDDYRLGLSKAFMGESCYVKTQYQTDELGNTQFNENGHFILANRDTQVGSKNGLDENGNTESLTINGYIADSRKYAYVKTAIELLGIDDVRADQKTGVKTVLNIDDIVAAQAEAKLEAEGSSSSVVLTDEQLAVLNADYDLTGTLGTEILNASLNSTVLDVVQMEVLGKTVEELVNSLLVTPVDLTVALEDIWQRLYDAPVATIFELLPVLMVLVDELVIPFVFNGDGDQWNKTIYNLLGSGSISDSLYLDKGSYIGVSQIGWDLNTLLPNLMHWLFDGSNAEGIEYYSAETKQLSTTNDTGDAVVKTFTADTIDTADLKHYVATDSNGNKLTREDKDGEDAVYSYLGNSNTDLSALLADYADTEFTYSYTYESDVPIITGVYIADLALRDANINDLPKLLSKVISNETVVNGLSEVVIELATMFTEAVDEFVNSDLRNEEKYANDGSVVGKGLNNIFVALPQLFDIMENLSAEKYGVDENAWTYCYDGKIVRADDGALRNSSLEDFKSFATSKDKNRSVDIFDCFAGIFVEQWLNSIVSLVNVAVATDNEITNNLPIVSGLIDALGGFGEESIFTDILNSIFQLKRGDDYSFEFKLDENTGLTGLNRSHAYFLITNVETLVDVVKALINSFKTNTTASTSSLSVASVLSSISDSEGTETPQSDVGSSGFTSDELKDADTVITELDTMLSSLLADSSINGFAINTTGNIASGIVSLLSNYISSENANDLLGLVDSYLYYLNGADERTADENGNMKPKEVYTNENLTDLTVRTFALIEDISSSLVSKFDYSYGTDENPLTYNLINEAVYGIISPDAIGVRLGDDDYKDAQKKIVSLNDWNDAIDTNDNVTIKIDWNIKDGDSDAFFEGLASSLRLVTSILGVLLIDTGWYETIVYPVLNALCKNVGVSVDTVEEFTDASNPYRDEVLLGLIRPISGWLNELLAAPATTLIKSIQGIADVIDDNNTEAGTIASIVSNAIKPITNELNGVANILNLESDKLGAISPTFADKVSEIATDNIGIYGEVENETLVNIKIKDIPLSGSNIIPIINTLLSSVGITLNNIDWSAIGNAKSPADAVFYVVEYVVDTVLSNDNIDLIASLIDNETVQTIIDAIKNGKLDGKSLIELLAKVLSVTKNPTLFAWSFEKYLQKAIEGFSYPLGLSKSQADEAAQDIDAVINNIFPLLQSLGIDLGGTSLKDILRKNLFTNKLLTSLATALYGTLDSNATVKTVLDVIGVKTSTADVAALLTDASYGNTFTAAADAIKAADSWNDVPANIDWGFTDNSANAQQGFVNALVAILRPLNDVLAVFLNSGELSINLDSLVEKLKDVNIDPIETYLAIGSQYAHINVTFEETKIVVTVVAVTKNDDETYTNVSGSKESTIVLDLSSLANIDTNGIGIYGTNGYNSAIIPLLEAFQCTGIVSETQYKEDIATSKDALLLDILNPILGGESTSLLNQIAANPLVTITTLLPNIATYIDADGLSQAVVNLLAPITNIIYAAGDLIDLNQIVATILKVPDGTSLGDYVASLIGMEAGSLNIDLTDLASFNLEDMIIPLVNTVIAGLTPDLDGKSDEEAASLTALYSNINSIQISNINWNTLISLGERTTYTSLATDLDGNALEGKALKNVDYGKVLITVLRYVLDNVLSNINSIQAIINSIEAISSNKTISGILDNVFTQLKTHTSDEIIVALYYFFVGENTSSFWDFTNYVTKSYDFVNPTGVTDEDVAKLITFIDGIIDELDLETLLTQYVYTDNIINTLAKLIYTNIENVKLSDSLKLGDILTAVGVSVDTNSVAELLKDKSYGETKQFKDAANAIASADSWANVDFTSLTWGVEDQETFLNALVAILRPLYGVLDVILADGQLNLLEGIDIPGSNGYESTIAPLLEVFRCDGVKSYSSYISDKHNKKDALLLDILNPLFGFVNKVVENPINTIASVIPNVALFIANDGLTQLVKNLITPVTAIVKDVNPLVDVDKLLQTLIGIDDISVTHIDTFLAKYISGENLVPTLNSLLASTGIQIDNIDWFYLASLGTVKNEDSAVTSIGDRIVVDGNSSQVIITLLRFVLDTVLSNKDAIVDIIGDSYQGTLKDIVDTIFNLNTDEILSVIFSLVNITQSPTEVYWCYENYKSELLKFTYPEGLTEDLVNQSITQLDGTVSSVFTLLGQLGVVNASDLAGLLNSTLFTNNMLTRLAVDLYGALDTDKLAPYLSMAGIPVSTKSVAALLVDTSYGATYSTASEAIAAKASWSELKTVTKNAEGKDVTTYANINWGFTDNAANAQQGFVNALVAILRPLLNVVGPFLNGSNLALGEILYNIIVGLDISSGSAEKGDTLITLKNGLLEIKTQSNGTYTTALSLDLSKLTTLKELNLYSSNGYENSIVPLLDVLKVDNSQIKSYSEYVKDCETAKDNILLDVLNPLMSFVNKVLEAPFDTITDVLPNLAYFIDNNGIGQLLDNLLSPVTQFIKNAKQSGIDVDGIIESVLGKDLGTFVAEKLGVSTKLNIKLADLSSCNIQEILIPLINSLLKSKGIVLPEFKWATIASHGTAIESTSKALNSLKQYTNKEISARKGETLIAVLRYVLDAVKKNITPIQNLLLGIEKVKKNATIVSVLNNVFTQVNTHTSDQIILAIYYFLIGENVDAYWNYTNYQTKEYEFNFPSDVTEEDVTKLIAFIDGIIGEIDLNSLLNQYLYTDNIINTLAKLIYTNIENVKLSDTIKLGQLLSALGISVDTKGVATLLADSSYGETKQFKSATDAIASATSWANVDFNSLSWGVKDQETFLNALVAILRPLYGVLDTIVADGKLNLLQGINIPGSNGYVNSIVPLLEAFRCDGIKTYEQYLADKSKSKDALLLDILTPLFGFVNDVVASPIETIASVLPNVSLFIANDGLIQLVNNLVTPIVAIVKDVNPIIDVDKLLQDLLKMPELSVTNLGGFLEKYIGKDNLVPLINSLLEKTGIKLNTIDWFYLASLGTVKNENSVVTSIGNRIVVDGASDKVLITILRYVLNTVLSNQDAIKKLIGDSYKGTLKEILDLVFGLKADDLLSLVFRLVDITQSPTEVFWSYKNYKSQLTKFKYPDSITADDAENAVGQLDNAVNAVFALLNGLDVIDSTDLSGLVSDMLFTNEMVTKLATTLYGALDTDKLAPYLSMAGIDVSTKGVAKLLTDKSYGKTFSSAAKTIGAAKSWKKITKVNWGFTDGSAKAEQGFINALVAVLRPLLNVVGPFLNGSDLALGEILYNVVVGLDISTGNKDKGDTLVALKNGKLTIKTQSNGTYSTALELNLANLKTLKTLNLYGSNGYENSIVPLLDVLQVDNSEIKTYDEYVKDCNKAKDNILLDVLNPLMSFVDKVLEAPFDTLTGVLPNLAYFIDNNGIGQLVDNLLSPVTQFLKDAKKDGVDADKIIKLIAGKDLGKLVTDLIGKKVNIKGFKLNLSLTNLSACNIQELVLPLVNGILKNKLGIKLPTFTWATIASHGDVVTSKSKAENAEGKFTNKEVIADKGETLVAVLRYLANTLVTNAKALNKLLCSIDAIKKNDTISSIIKSVFNTISNASADQIVVAIFYFLKEEPTNAFWDYTAYQTGEYDFSYPDTVDVDFLQNLPPMLDGLIGGFLDLNDLIGKNVFKDEIISKLAVGLYGAIEGVSINSSTNLAQLLAMTDIDFTTTNVANLLVDERYGQSYASASSVIASAGSWAKVNTDSLKWGVTDRDSFFHALVAVLRPIYGVLDVLLNDASLGLFDIVRIPGSNGYTSSIVPLMEAFSMYNIKTQYQYREDINEEYDNILLDIINPLWDKIEDLLNAPLQTLTSMIPNLALFIGNDGLCQIIDNLLTPVSALVDAIKPVVDLNDLVDALLSALNVDLNSILGKIGVTNFSLDLYDLNATLKPILGGDAIIPLINNVLGLIKISGQPLGIKLNDVDWLQLASHGETIVAASQAATYGSRIYVEGDSSETLMAVLRYLINTVNTGDNLQVINDLISGLLGDSVSDDIASVIGDVLDMLKGDTDDVIASLVDLLQTFA